MQCTGTTSGWRELSGMSARGSGRKSNSSKGWKSLMLVVYACDVRKISLHRSKGPLYACTVSAGIRLGSAHPQTTPTSEAERTLVVKFSLHFFSSTRNHKHLRFPHQIISKRSREWISFTSRDPPQMLPAWIPKASSVRASAGSEASGPLKKFWRDAARWSPSPSCHFW